MCRWAGVFLWGTSMSQWWIRWREIVRENRKYLLVSSSLFGGGIVLGLGLMLAVPDEAGEAFRRLIEPMNRMAEQLGGMSRFSQAAFILGNNLRVALMMMAGALLLGIVPPVTLLSNGFLIGLFAANLLSAGTPFAWRVLLGLVPHGVFEIPAVLLAAAMGLRIGRELWRGILGRGWAGLRQALGQAATLLPAVMLLLVVAAGTEAYVSPTVMGPSVG